MYTRKDNEQREDTHVERMRMKKDGQSRYEAQKRVIHNKTSHRFLDKK